MKALQPEVIKEVTERLVAHLQPEAVYLYGSHAYGAPHDDSDIDLYVVVSDSPLSPHQRAASAYLALYETGLPVEVQVATQEEFARRGAWLNSIEREIQERGRLLYGSR